MRHTLKIGAVLFVALVVTACATVGGSMIGPGIGRASGDERTGALIGGGIGMMIDTVH
jgi:predicted small secreted protein